MFDTQNSTYPIALWPDASKTASRASGYLGQSFFFQIIYNLINLYWKMQILEAGQVKISICQALDITISTHWGRVTHICVSILNTIGSDNGLSPVRRQAIIWTNADILLIGPLGASFNEILI